MAGQNQGDSGDFFALFSVAIVIAIYLFLSSNFEYVSTVWRWMRIAEIGAFYWVPDWLPFFGDLDFKGAFHLLWNSEPEFLSKDFVEKFDKRFVSWISWIPAIVLIFYGLKRVNLNANKSLIYDMDRLLTNRLPLYSHLKGLDKVNPGKLDDDQYYPSEPETSEYSVSVNPEQFATMIPPLGLENESEKELFNKPIWDEDENTFDDDLAERAFSSQLGRTFSKLSDMTDYENKIYELFTSKTSTKKAYTLPILTKFVISALDEEEKENLISSSLTEKGKELLEAIENYVYILNKKQKLSKENLKNKIISNKVALNKVGKDKSVARAMTYYYTEEILLRHTYVRTGLMSLLEIARGSGVLTTGDFKWLKKVDRTLWYCMSTIGRRVAFAESAGCYAHWTMEKYINQPISHPEVTEAVLSLKEYLGVIDAEDVASRNDNEHN